MPNWKKLIVSGSDAALNTVTAIAFTGSLFGTASSAISASYAPLPVFTSGLIVTGSLKGNVTALSIVSSTASMDLTVGNFFTLTLGGGSTNIEPTNITAGQTTTLLITTSPGSAITFPSSVKQPSGSAYVPSTATGAKDVLTFISYDSTDIYVANIKNLI